MDQQLFSYDTTTPPEPLSSALPSTILEIYTYLSEANSSIMTSPTFLSTMDDAEIPMLDMSDSSADPDDLIHNEYVQIFFYIIYATVFVLGVFGNVLVCYVVICNRAMQTVTNIFITNMALSDILLCVLAVPFTPLYTFMGRWAFGRTLCHLVSFAQGCSIYISTLTLTSIAIDRYFVIIYPFHPRMKLSTCIGIIVSIWVVALLATLPYGMYVKVHEVIQGRPNDTDFATLTANMTKTLNNTNTNLLFYGIPKTINVPATLITVAETYQQIMLAGSTTSPEMPSASTTSYCEENWPSEHYRKVFGSVTTILQFILPFLVISICYIWISVKLNQRARAKPGSKSSRREEADRDRKKRTNRMLISMVAVFGLSWLPINVVNIFGDFYEKSNEWRFYTLLFFVAHSIAMSSTCYNPFLYAWLNENFRKEFKHVIPCFYPSNNSLLSITRGFNRSERNTCGPRLIRVECGAVIGGSAEENGTTQETSLQTTREKLLIIPREATYGKSSQEHILQSTDTIDMTLKDKDNETRHWRHHVDNDIDSSDETVEVKFCETPFNDANMCAVKPIPHTGCE